MEMELKSRPITPEIHGKSSLSVHQTSLQNEKLTHAGILAQQSALVLMAQIQIDSFFAESGLDAIPLAATQSLFKLSAKYYLDELQTIGDQKLFFTGHR
ncbi:hypothetical protein [Pseudomonas weihenstephanensis]|uniref:hypothetical protein n=1 Tax=Pseudomonas weihenstephanensis TaxID=1608994 RepID=UPI0006534164|nr:hypothetical protein [Pseudomonas weihenstephanensis]KMN17919.1 hypothetical protein TU87_15420 [Pseudomonas weihenstephanensis]